MNRPPKLPKIPGSKLSRISIKKISVASLIILGVAVIGSLVLHSSKAAGPFVVAEAEAGTVTSSPALKLTDSSASGGQAVQFAAPSTSGLTAQELTAVKSKRILFGHQSVGANMVQGIPALYSSYGVSPPTMISNLSQINSAAGGFFAEFYVGTNGDPIGKAAAFNTTVRQYGSRLDVALFKLCFVDMVSGVNAQQVFNAYKSTMDGLTRDFPNIKFVYTTAALDEWSVDNAVVREQYNALIRQQYGSTGRLFDLAKVESTRPDGTRVSGTSNGTTYYQLYDPYSSDGGHLNATGQQVMDKALFTILVGL